MQITINVKDGSNAEAIARALRFNANLIQGMDAKKAAANANTGLPGKKAKPADEDEEVEDTEDDETEDTEDTDDADESEEESEDDDTEEESEDEESEESEDDDTEEESEDEEPPKKAKGKKLTAKEQKMLKQVNVALRKRAQKTSFDKVKVWLKKKFKVSSINDLKPTQYGAVIKAAKVLKAA